MASPIIAFLAGAGTGYLKQRDVEDQRKRDEEDQQFKRDQQGAWRKLQAEADSLKTNLKNAQAGAEVVEGGVGDQSAGAPVPSIQSPPPVVAAGQPGTTGQPEAPSAPVTTMAAQVGNQPPAPAAPPVFRMVAPGGVNQTFNSAAEAQAAAKEYSSPAAMNARLVAAYRAAGQPDKALEVERNINQGQMSKLQLDDAIQARADKAWDQGLNAAAANAESLAKYFSGSPLVGGNQVKAVPSADGKTVQFFSVGADGQQTALYQPVSSDPSAWAPLLTQMSRSLQPEQRLQHMYRLDESRRLQANADRDFELRKQARDDDREYKRGVLALRGSGGGSGGKGGAAEPAAFDPLSDFDPKQARKAAMDQALDEAKNNPGSQPMSEKQIAARAQAIYAGLRDAASADNSMRQRATVFASAAKGAKTDEEVQAIKDRAIKSGFTEEEMGRIDPRFAPTPAPKQAAPSSTKQPQKKASTPVAAEQVGSGLPPAAEAAGVRLDKARADLAQLRASRPPGLKDGNAARDAFARQIKAAEDELDAADAAFQGAASPFVAAAYGSRRK
ncbi:hypothetical protein CTTA_4947 [Comamonas testosteroni]|uniref:Uncharacterized protein n=1 Tax=Comamonas testosteroni TaxID=285 RepID=A0A5A7MJT9_COMTE|nr:hypothetical protein [Comamonas testosteroni]GEQ77942.1 hypothetical protein CTTA_4947 [Comamonas testosteroni]